MSEGIQSGVSVGAAVSAPVSAPAMSSMETGMARAEGVKAPITASLFNKGESTLARVQGEKVADKLVDTVQADGIHEAMESLDKGDAIIPSGDISDTVEVETSDSKSNNAQKDNTKVNNPEYKKIWGELYAEAKATGKEVDMDEIDRKAEITYNASQKTKGENENSKVREDGEREIKDDKDLDTPRMQNPYDVNTQMERTQVQMVSIMKEISDKLDKQEVSPEMKEMITLMKQTMEFVLMQQKEKKKEDEKTDPNILMMIMMAMMVMLGPVLNEVTKEK